MADAGRPLRTRLAITLGLAGAALAFGLLVIVASLVRLSDSRRVLVDRIDPAGLAARDLRTAVVDQETGVRGYALTRDRRFLEPYERGRATEAATVARLHELLDGFVPGADVDAVAAAVARWRTETADPTVAGVERESPAVESGAFLDAGRTNFDEARRMLDRLDAAVAAERRHRADDLFTTAGQVGIAVAFLAGTLLVVGAVLFIAMRRTVTGPVERLGAEVRLVAGGDLGRPVTGEGSVEVVGLAADIEAMRRRILDELARLREASAAIERQSTDLARSNADLEQFAYVASHDLQEPLRKVAGFCQLLQRRYGGQLDDRADEYIHYAVDGAQRMQQLINDLLAFSRVGRTTERFEPVDLGEAAGRAVDALGSAIEATGASVAVDALPTVSGDARLLAAVFQNLIGNAVKFHRPGVAPEVVVHASVDGGEVTVSVSDNGIGIDPRYADQIFTLFKRLHTKTEYEGTGIGLALCQRIVEFHGGRLWLEATDGPGSTFRFTLPVPDDKEPTRG